jgi:hypothetical protein
MDGISINATAMSAKFQSRVGRMQSFVETEGAKAVEAQMHSIRQVIINTSPVDTGRLKASWSPVTGRGTLAFGCGTAVPYASTLEYGGYSRVGPRTIHLGGAPLGAGFVAQAGIYSQQAPLGFVRKALAGASRQFRLRMRNVLRQGWGGLGQTDILSPEEAESIVGVSLGGGGGSEAPRGRSIAMSQSGRVDPFVLNQIFESFTRSVTPP